ncbi:MAG: MFS transporter, partial [Dehalococcoides mccartyi]
IGFIFWKMRGWDMAESRGEKFDYMGSLVYGLGVVAAMAGTTILPDPSAIWYILAGIIAFSMFIWRELNYTSPIFDVRLFTKNRPFILSNLAALINYSATFGVGFLMSLYLQYIRGFSPQSAGLVLVAMPIIQAGLSPFAGRLSDRIQPRFVATAGMGLTTIGLALLSTLSMDTPLVFIIISLVLLGMGFALFSSPNTNAVMSSVERKHYGVASGTLSTMRLSGQMISLAVVMFLFSLILGPVNISPENYEGLLTSMRTAMILFTTLCFIGIFASLSRGNTRKP